MQWACVWLDWPPATLTDTVRMQTDPLCWWSAGDMVNHGAAAFGYADFDELWRDYTVFALVRNPYDRAGSSYDYILDRRQVRIVPRVHHASCHAQLVCGSTRAHI